MSEVFTAFSASLQDDILKISTTRSLCARNFRIFFDKFSLSTRTDEQILQCDNFFLAKCICSKSYHASFWTSALVKEKIDKFFFTHQQIKFAKSKLVKENLLVCNQLKQLILMRNVLRSAENQQQNANDGAVHHQDTTENRGDFNYDEVLRWISALGRSTYLC